MILWHKSHIFRYTLRADELWCDSTSYVLRLDFLHYDQNLDLSDAVFRQKSKNVFLFHSELCVMVLNINSSILIFGVGVFL